MATKVSADGEAQCDHQSRANVYVARFVVLPEGKNPDRRKQGPQRRSLGTTLVHMEEEDQRGNDQYAAARPHYAGDGADH